MVINIHAGHNPDGKVACGSAGILKESTEARNVKNLVVEKLRNMGHTVYDCTVDDGTSQNDVLRKIVAKCNTHKADLDVSIHLNSGRNDYTGDGSTGGVEVYIFRESDSTKAYAERVCAAISGLGFRNRGVKVNPKLYVLQYTNAPAMLIECCFVDDGDDAKLYDCERMADAIVKGIVNAIPSEPPLEPTPIPVPAPIQQFRPFWGAVTENDTNVRNAPNMGGAVIDKASNGQTVLVVEQDGAWYKVAEGKWIHSSLVRKTGDYTEGQAAPQSQPIGQPAPAPSQPSSTYPYKGAVTGAGVRIRSGAGVNYSVIGSTSKGQEVLVFDEKDGWCQIDNGKWISKQYVKKI